MQIVLLQASEFLLSPTPAISSVILLALTLRLHRRLHCSDRFKICRHKLHHDNFFPAFHSVIPLTKLSRENEVVRA